MARNRGHATKWTNDGILIHWSIYVPLGLVDLFTFTFIFMFHNAVLILRHDIPVFHERWWYQSPHILHMDMLLTFSSHCQWNNWFQISLKCQLSFWIICPLYHFWLNKLMCHVDVESSLSCLSFRTLEWRHNERNGVSNHRRPDCLFNCFFRRRSTKTSKFRATGLCEGNPPVTGGFSSQRASKAENILIWRHHHGINITILFAKYRP